jgi:hypothetical protein
MTKKPPVTGGLLLLFGYILAFICRKERSVPPEVVVFRRQEQMARLQRILAATIASRHPDSPPLPSAGRTTHF